MFLEEILPKYVIPMIEGDRPRDLDILINDSTSRAYMLIQCPSALRHKSLHRSLPTIWISILPLYIIPKQIVAKRGRCLASLINVASVLYIGPDEAIRSELRNGRKL